MSDKKKINTEGLIGTGSHESFDADPNAQASYWIDSQDKTAVGILGIEAQGYIKKSQQVGLEHDGKTPKAKGHLMKHFSSEYIPFSPKKRKRN